MAQKKSNTKTTTVKTSNNNSKNNNTKNNNTKNNNNNAKAWGWSTVGTNVPKTNVSLTPAKNSSPVPVGTAKNGWTLYSDWSVRWGMSTPSNNNNTKKNNTTPSNTSKNNTTTLSNGVKATNNGNGTTTYTKPNGDKWTESSSWQVISKTVGGKTTNYWAWDTSWGIYSTPANNTSKTWGTTGTTKTPSPINTVLGWVWPNYLNSFTNNISGALSGKNNSNSGNQTVSQVKNKNWTTTYKKANWDTWTEDSSWRVISKTVGGKTTNYWAWDTSWGIYQSTLPTNAQPKTSSTKIYPVASLGGWKVRMSDGSVVTETQANTYNTTNNVTKKKTTPVTTNTTTSLKTNNNFNYMEQNANGSPARATYVDGTILYEDGSRYNPVTWETIDKNWNVVKNQWVETKATEWDIRNNANMRQNNTDSRNSSNYNPISNNKNVTTDRNNQSALTMILKNQQGASDGQGNITTVKSNSLDTGWNRNIWSKENLSQNDDGSYTYIAPNGKTYTIGTDTNWNLAFNSQWWATKGTWQNLQDQDTWEFFNDVNDFVDYIKSQNQVDGINRSNVDNRNAVRDAEIVGTYNAPSGKEYDILTNEDWKVGFVNINWDAQWFDTQDAALNYIDKNNPVGNKDLSKNTIKPEWQNRVSDVIEDMNEGREEDKEEEQDRNEELEEFVREMFEDWQNSQDEIDRNKYNILNQSLMDFDNFQTKLDDAVADLEEKSKLLQDNERMRWARQRAQQLAAQWYLTSEQVAQVANYSLTDYNKELEANALEAAKAIAELRLNIAQKANDALAAIRTQQFSNENDRMNQINFVNEWRTKMEDAINSKMSQVDQFYNGLINSNLAMNAQNELGYESIINQNKAQNIADDQNQMRAFTDPVYRRQYILDHITDANLHWYAAQAIQYLINNWTFIFPWKSNADNKRILTEQINKVTDAARQLQLENQKDLAKS